MLLRWNRAKNFIKTDAGVEYFVTNEVRNELNSRRRLHDSVEVVRTMPSPGKPYMPRQFPLGKWRVRKPELRNDEYKRPIYIPTDAYQDVHVWALDEKGGYDYQTNELIRDYGYGLHFSEASRTTLGCGRVGSRSQVLRLAAEINLALDRGEEVYLEVFEE